MEKPWFLSKTIWGAIILAVWQILNNIPDIPSQPYLTGTLAVLGTLLAVIGLRDAIAKNKNYND